MATRSPNGIKRRRGRAGSALLIACVATPLEAAEARHDAEVESWLSWSAPPGCPDQDEIHERVRASLRGRPPPNSSFEADGAVTRSGDRYELRLRTRSGHEVEVRTFEEPSCATLADVATLIVIFQLYAIREDTQAPELTSRAPALITPRVAAGVALDVGQVSRGGGGLMVTAGLLVGRYVGIELSGFAFAPRRTPYDRRPGAGASLQVFALEAKGCLRHRVLGVTLGPCLGVAPSLLRGDGYGFVETFARNAFWVSLLAGSAIARRVSPHVELVGQASIVWSPDSPNIVARLDGRSASVYAPAHIGSRTWIGLACIF